MQNLKLIFVLITLLFISCDGDYSKPIINYTPIEIEVLRPSPNDNIYHLWSNKYKIEENFILEIYKNDSLILIKSYKNQNGYVDKDSGYVYNVKKILIKDIELSKEEYDKYIKSNELEKLWINAPSHEQNETKVERKKENNKDDH